MANDQQFRYVAKGEAGDLAEGLIKLHAHLSFAGGGLEEADFEEAAKFRAEKLRKKYKATDEQTALFLAALVGEIALFVSLNPPGTCTVKVSA